MSEKVKGGWFIDKDSTTEEVKSFISEIETHFKISREFDPISDVETFHRHINALVSSSPTLLSSKLSKLRFNCMKEENGEYMDATKNLDIVNIIEELVDQQYFLFGTIIMHGLQQKFWPAFYRKHTSNMSKTPNGDQKALKGENYQPANLKDLFDDVCKTETGQHLQHRGSVDQCSPNDPCLVHGCGSWNGHCKCPVITREMLERR